MEIAYLVVEHAWVDCEPREHIAETMSNRVKLTFLTPDGIRIIVRRLRPAPDWADGERLFGRMGGLFGLFGTRVLLYFVGTANMGQLAALWKIHPRVQILPPKGYRLEL